MNVRSYNTIASWYGHESGSHTANGARWNPGGMTVAHRTLPMGTKLKITNPRNGKVVTATVTDRGPASYTGRSLDVSEGVAKVLGIKEAGVAKLHIEIQ